MLCSYPNPIEDKCPGNYTNPLKVQTVIILGKVILWILHFLLERYIQYHHSKVRNRGYNKIYRSTRHLKSLALMIHSTGKPSCLTQLFGGLLECNKWQQKENVKFDFTIKYMLSFFIYLFIYLFWAVLGLCCCAQVFSSCGEREPLFVAVRGLLIAVASLVAEHGL